MERGRQEPRLRPAPAALLGFFTRLPVGRNAAIEDVAASFPFVGLVGWATGGLGALGAVLLWELLPAEALAAVLVVIVVGATGLNQTDGLLDLGDGLMAHGNAERRLEVMRDHSVGAGGFGFGLVTYLVAYACLAGVARTGDNAGLELPGGLAGLVVLAEVGARVPYLLLAWKGRPSHAGLGALFMSGFGVRQAAAGALVVAPAGALVLFVGAAPVIAGLAAAVLTGIVLLRISEKTLGGVGGDVFGASQELARSAVLLGAVAAIGLAA